MDQIFDKVLSRVKECYYYSYDPYDGASTRIQWLSKYYGTRLFLTYFNKFSPVNIRPFFRIPQSRQIQCLAFIGLALVEYDTRKYLKEIAEISEIIKNETMVNQYGYHCWESHGFPIQMRGKLREPGIPDVVGNEACGRLLMAYYELTGDMQAKEQAISFRDYLLEELFTTYRKASFFRYKPTNTPNQCTYNASAIAAAYIIEINKAIDSNKGNEHAYEALELVVSQQNPDGSWYYSIDLNTDIEKKQIDFHQGFILDTLLIAMKTWPEATHFQESYEKGLEFYYTYQFNKEGRSYYRLPKKWPVNIHNQSQGIITFTKAARAGFGDNYQNFAKTIADWTIRNMQGRDGHFYYMKYPFFTNKISYIRWSDTNMLYAMATYLNNKSK